jgi:radical SAM protein with 4Fe4S-binding SPASM domain
VNEIVPETSGTHLRALVVMARRAKAGQAKTRLATGIGPARALEVYVTLLGDTMVRAQSTPSAALFVALADGVPGRQPGLEVLGLGSESGLTPAAWTFIHQTGDSLGERLAEVFSALFGRGADSVAIISSDSPGLPKEYLSAGFELLETRGGGGAGAAGHVVLGPAADGGYYLIGLGRSTWGAHEDALRSLLGGTPMGSSRALPFTLREASRLGLHVDQLPLWVDVDKVADLPLMERLIGSEGREAPRGEPLERLREIYLHVTHRCGLRCPHCYDKSSPRDPGELSTVAWKNVIDQCLELGAESFVFIGGDPLLRHDLVELIDYVAGTRQAKARLFFNRSIDRDTAFELAQAGHGRFRPLLSLDGPPATNDALRGAGNWDGVMASIGHLLEAGLAPVVNTVPLKPVLPGLPEMARLIRAAGVTRLHLIFPHDRGGLPDVPDLIPSGAEMLQGLHDLQVAADEVDLFVDNIPAWRRRLKAPQDFCNAGCKDLAIDPFGRVYACPITCGDPAFVAGDLRSAALEDIWRASPAFRLLRNVHARDRSECRDCPVVDACGGECWMQAHYAARAAEESGGYAAPFPYCDLVRPVMLQLMDEEAETHKASAPPTVFSCSGEAHASCDAGQAVAGERNLALFDCI